MELDELVTLYSETFYMEDTRIIPLVAGTAASNPMPGDPIWLMINGGPGSGKSEIINAIRDVDYVEEVSTLTPNTLLSGIRVGAGQEEVSLLHRIQSGVIAMKDFTTLLSHGKEALNEIMGQLREVYDGSLVKHTGNKGKDDWAGKINLIAGVTDEIYNLERTFSAMGSRWITYEMPSVDRREITRRSIHNATKIDSNRREIREAFSSYITKLSLKIPAVMPDLESGFDDAIIDVADLSSLARSSVARDPRTGKMTLVYKPEMGTRIAQQMTALTKMFYIMLDTDRLPDEYRELVYKVGFDSIPKIRRRVMRVLSEYDSLTTADVSVLCEMASEDISDHLHDLMYHGIVNKNTMSSAYVWSMKREYSESFRKYNDIKRKGTTYTRGSDFMTDDSVQLQEHNEISAKDYKDF